MRIKVRLRHKIVNKIASPFITAFLKKKFNYTYESCDLKPPFLVLANHTTDFDPFFIAKSFKNPIYYVMSDHVSSLKSGSLIKFLVSPIPITKSSIDAGTVRDVISVIKQGAAVGIFPEGNKSFDGEMSFIKPSISKLVKKLNVPLVLYTIEGGYFSSPRWSKIKRKGHVHGFANRIIMPEEYEKMTNEDLYDQIIKYVSVNAYDVQAKGKVKYVAPEDRCKGIESFMYTCPVCKKFSTLKGEGNEVHCSACNFHASLDEYGNLEGCNFTRLDKYDDWQKQNLDQIDFAKAYKENEVITSDENWDVQQKITKLLSRKLGFYKLELTNKELKVSNPNYSFEIALEDISGFAIEGACGIQLWLNGGEVYRFKNANPSVSGLKYVNIIARITGLPYKF